MFWIRFSWMLLFHLARVVSSIWHFEVWLISFLLKTFKLQQKILNQSKLSFVLLNCCKKIWISQSSMKVQFQRLPRFSSHISPPTVRSLVTSFQASVSNAFLVYQCTEYHFPFRKKVKTWVDIWRCNKKLNMCNILYPNWSRSCLTYSWPDQFYTTLSFLPQSAMANDMTWQIWKGKLHVSFKWVMGQVWTADVLIGSLIIFYCQTQKYDIPWENSPLPHLKKNKNAKRK